MLKITIEVNEAKRISDAVMCGCESKMEGKTNRAEILAMSAGLAKCFAELIKVAPDNADAIYKSYEAALKKELGV